MSEHITRDAPDEQWLRRMLPWLERLADPADVRAAATALWEIRLEEYQSRTEKEQRSGDTPEEREADAMRLFLPALDALGDRADALLPRWVERYVEELADQFRRQQALEAA